MELINSVMKWYVLQAYSGYENKVKQTLEDMIKREGLEDSFGEILVLISSGNISLAILPLIILLDINSIISARL